MANITSSMLITWVLLIIVIAILIFNYFARLRISPKPSENEISASPPSGHHQVLDDDSLPENAKRINKTTSFSSLGYEFNFIDNEVEIIRLNNVPDGVSPYLIPVSAEEREELQNIYKDGFFFPIDIVGNLIFVDDESKKLVKIFKSPIELSFKYSSKYMDDVLLGGEKIIKEVVGGEKILKDVFSDKVAELVPLPVFLYSVNIKGEGIRVWKPFQKYNTDPTTRNITVAFQVWGDMHFGSSTLKVPIDWGPP